MRSLAAGQRQVIALCLGWSLLLFGCSSARHLLFQSSSVDLGWFDQATYLISQGQAPIVSFSGYHILGDHVAWVFYPLALLYRIYPSVYWLFAVQSLALASGGFLTWRLALQSQLLLDNARAIAIAYLLYPLVFNVNLFDFHPDVIAVPLLLGALLAAQSQRFWGFVGCIVGVLGCKAILALTTAALGLFLLLMRRRYRLDYRYGTFALVSSIAWFAIATFVLIPHFTGLDAAVEMADNRYQFLGDSLQEIILNLFLKPHLLLRPLFTVANLEYVVLLFAPVIWGLSLQQSVFLLPALPAFFLNLVTSYQAQKDLVHQYSLPILPFLIVTLIMTVSHGQAWLQRSRSMVLWSLVAFVALAKYGYFGSIYLDKLDTWHATRAALQIIQTDGSVLTTNAIAPHLTHRTQIGLAVDGAETRPIEAFDYILLDERHPSWQSSPATVRAIIDRADSSPQFEKIYQNQSVFVFQNVDL